MRCPKCGHEFKSPGAVAGGLASKRAITPKQQRKMQRARKAKRKANAERESRRLQRTSPRSCSQSETTKGE